MEQLSRHLRYVLILLAFFVTTFAKADVWDNPRVATYFSENKEFKLVITPKITPDKYYLWNYYKSNKYPQTKKILRQKEKFMQNILVHDTIQIPCTGELYRIIEKDTVLLWERKLLNETCPAYAIVANDGSSVATFDNWYSAGYGVNVFVIYNEKGDAKRTYKLEEFSPLPLNDYMTSISSLHWNIGDKFVDNERVEIIFRAQDDKQEKRIYNTRTLEFEK